MGIERTRYENLMEPPELEKMETKEDMMNFIRNNASSMTRKCWSEEVGGGERIVFFNDKYKVKIEYFVYGSRQNGHLRAYKKEKIFWGKFDSWKEFLSWELPGNDEHFKAIEGIINKQTELNRFKLEE